MKNLKDKGVDVVVASEVGPGAKTLLQFTGIRMIQVKPGAEISEAVEIVLKEFGTATSA